MADILLADLKQRLRSQRPADDVSLRDMRAAQDRGSARFRLDPEMAVESVQLAGCGAEWLTPRRAPADCAIFYLHGGAFVAGSCISHRPLASAIACEAGMKTLVLEYRLAPEHPWPAAEEDVWAAWQELVDQGYRPRNLVVAGDSAGGNLAMQLLLRLRTEHKPMPRRAALLSPWIDLDLGSASVHTLSHVDPTLDADRLARFASLYRNRARGPHILDSEMSGLPPILVQAGENELLRDDAARLAAVLKAADVSATLEIWRELFHVWHAFWPWLAEARAANARVGDFLKQQERH